MARFLPVLAAGSALLVGAPLAVSAAAAAPVAPTDHLKDKHHQAQRDVRHAQSNLDDSSAALRAAGRRLSAAQQRLTDAERRLADTQQRLGEAKAKDAAKAAELARAEQQLADAQDAVGRAKAAIVAQREKIGSMVAHNYQTGDPRLLGLSAMLNAGNADDVTTQMGAVHSLMSEQAEALRELRRREAALRREERKVAGYRAEVAREKAASAAYVEQRRAIEQEADTRRQEVSSLVRERSVAQTKASAVQAADAATLRRAQAQEARVVRLIAERARRQRNRIIAARRAAAARAAGAVGNGILLRPVDGVITSPYGWRMHPIYHYWGLHNGDDFAAPCGTPALAPESGTVISEYYSPVWGNRLYLDMGKINGVSLTAVYNHMQSYRVGPGAHVSRGESVGHTGTTGWSTGCHLHFTLLRNGTPTNPAAWF